MSGETLKILFHRSCPCGCRDRLEEMELTFDQLKNLTKERGQIVVQMSYDCTKGAASV